MSQTKYTKLYFMLAPPGYGYHAGLVHNVPKAKAEEFIKAGYAKETTPVLPNDFPHRAKLIEAGIETLEDLHSVKNLKDLSKDLDEAAEKEITEFIKKKPKPEAKSKAKKSKK